MFVGKKTEMPGLLQSAPGGYPAISIRCRYADHGDVSAKAVSRLFIEEMLDALIEEVKQNDYLHLGD